MKTPDKKLTKLVAYTSMHNSKDAYIKQMQETTRKIRQLGTPQGKEELGFFSQLVEELFLTLLLYHRAYTGEKLLAVDLDTNIALMIAFQNCWLSQQSKPVEIMDHFRATHDWFMTCAKCGFYSYDQYQFATNAENN